MTEYDEAKEQTKGQGGYDEEVDGRDVVTVSGQEGPPRRRRVTGGAAHVLSDGEGGDFVAEEVELGLTRLREAVEAGDLELDGVRGE